MPKILANLGLASRVGTPPKNPPSSPTAQQERLVANRRINERDRADSFSFQISRSLLGNRAVEKHAIPLKARAAQGFDKGWRFLTPSFRTAPMTKGFVFKVNSLRAGILDSAFGAGCTTSQASWPRARKAFVKRPRSRCQNRRPSSALRSA